MGNGSPDTVKTKLFSGSSARGSLGCIALDDGSKSCGSVGADAAERRLGACTGILYQHKLTQSPRDAAWFIGSAPTIGLEEH